MKTSDKTELTWFKLCVPIIPKETISFLSLLFGSVLEYKNEWLQKLG